MITKWIDKISIVIVPQEADDLIILRRVINKSDKITTDTTRVIKRDRDDTRPDKGERIKVRITLYITKLSLDDLLDRLRISGKIEESSNDQVSKGSHHSITVKIGQRIKITKQKWENFQKNRLKTKPTQGFVLVSIDTRDCGIARVNGAHLDILPNITSSASGKRYKTNFDIEKYLQEIIQIVQRQVQDNEQVLIFGPGETKKMLGKKISAKINCKIIEGIDVAGEDGIYIFVKSEEMIKVMSDSKLAIVNKILQQVIRLAGQKNNKFTIGFDETNKANQLGMIESLVFSDKIIQTHDEQKVMDLLNNAEENGVKIFGVDNTTDIGTRVSALGGIISLLRYPMIL